MHLHVNCERSKYIRLSKHWVGYYMPILTTYGYCSLLPSRMHQVLKYPEMSFSVQGYQWLHKEVEMRLREKPEFRSLIGEGF